MRQREVIGLDIGSHSAKAVHVRRLAGAWSIRVADWVRLPEDALERQRMLSSFISRHEWQNLSCVVPVSGESVILHSVLVPRDDTRSIREVIRQDTARFSGLTEEGTVSDFIVQKSIRGRRCAFLAVGRMDGILRTVETFREIGLQIIDVAPSAVAAFNAVLQLSRIRRSRPFMCINIGHWGTDVIVGRRRQILFARRFPQGTEAFEEDHAAERKKGAAEAWLAELGACMQLYGAQYSDERLRPAKIVLTGGGGLIPGVKESIQEASGIDTARWSDVTGIRGIEEPERYATAIGLALQGLGKGAVNVSLLPRGMKEDLVLKWQKKFWLLSGLCLIAGVLVLSGGTYRELKALRRHLHERRGELLRLKALNRRLEDYRFENENLRRQSIPFVRAVHNGQILRAVLHAVGSALHPDDWITFVGDARSYTSPDDTGAVSWGGGTGEGETGVGFSQIVIEGYTPIEDMRTVRAMIETLRQSPGIVAADLLADDRLREDPERDERWALSGCRLFAVEIRVPIP